MSDREVCEHYKQGDCPECNAMYDRIINDDMTAITALRSRVEELETQLALAKPMYSRRQLEAKVSDLERENADWLKYYNEMQSLDYPSHSELDAVKRAAYERFFEILAELRFELPDFIVAAIRDEMEKVRKG